ncbi:MAG: response regulator, partial [Defluviitaleaceae bacterium]|nr:response regulator [Defluviitaleaceae bacterium]
FEIKDTGTGMTTEEINRVYEPFDSVGGFDSLKRGETRLGLIIANNIIELMGGKLEIESVPGAGSKYGFEVQFEIIEGHTYEPESSAPAARGEKPYFEGEVLLCEDNRIYQLLMTEHLERAGLVTVVADNGAEGVELVKRRMINNAKPFDLIFMDIYMPVMDGFEAASLITSFETGTPIVALTANIMDEEQDVYTKKGMVDCIGKPFNSHELWRCLLKYIMPSDLAAASAEPNPLEEAYAGKDKAGAAGAAGANRDMSVPELIECVENLLRTRNTDCLNYIGALRAFPGTDKLIRQMEDFDFMPAAATLSALKTKWV